MAGTTWDVVVLNSSPPTSGFCTLTSRQNVPPTCRVPMLASSPPRLSPPASPKRPISGASRTNSRAAAIPDGAVRGFATVGTLVQSDYFAQQVDDDITGKEQPQLHDEISECAEEATAAVKRPRKPATRRSASGGIDKPKPKPRARKAKAGIDDPTHDPELRLPESTKSLHFHNDQSEVLAPTLTKSGKPRKPRAKKQNAEDSNTTAEAKPKKKRATKPTKVSKDESLDQRETSVVSAYFDQSKDEEATRGRSTINSPGIQTVENNEEKVTSKPRRISPSKKQTVPKNPPPDPFETGLALQQAVARRRDWTPPAEDTAIQAPVTDSVGKENTQSATNENGTFTHLVSNFAYAQPSVLQTKEVATNSTVETPATTKRRRVELVEIPSNQNISRNSSPEKAKAPKKKPRTITDLVTDQYVPKALETIPKDATNDCLQAQPNTTKVPLNDTVISNPEVPQKKPPRKRNQSKSDSDKTGTKSKHKKAAPKSRKPKTVAEKLLSPSSALTRLNRQDFLFGTSSQLALDESPMTVRQLQQAMEASEQDVDALIGEPPDSLLRWPKLRRLAGGKGHWAASARNGEGGTLEQMEDVHIPEPDRRQDFPLSMDGTNDESDGQRVLADAVNTDPHPVILIASDLPTPPRSISRLPQTVEFDEDKLQTDAMAFQDIDDFEQEPPPSNQNARYQQSFADIDDFILSSPKQRRVSSPQNLSPPIPTTVTADGSPKKRRGRPPKSQSSKTATSASPTSPSKASSSRKKGKEPAKDASTSPSTPPKPITRFIDIEEILDSEDEALEALSPTPPRVRKLADSPPLPLISTATPPTKETSKSKSKSKSKPTSASTSTTTTNSQTPTPIFLIPTTHLDWPALKPQVFQDITTHIRSLPPTSPITSPTWHDRILMYQPLIIEDFTTHLNTQSAVRTYKKATQKQINAWNKELKRNGQTILTADEGAGEVLAVHKHLEMHMVQAWCESLSVCCVWRGEGRERGRKSRVRNGFY